MVKGRKRTVRKALPRRSAEDRIAAAFTAAGVIFSREVLFHPTRRWRADFRVLCEYGNILVEYEGGVFRGGRHTRGTGYAEDCRKYNAATKLGYRVMRYTSADLVRNGEYRIAQEIKEMIG